MTFREKRRRFSCIQELEEVIISLSDFDLVVDDGEKHKTFTLIVRIMVFMFQSYGEHYKFFNQCFMPCIV